MKRFLLYGTILSAALVWVLINSEADFKAQSLQLRTQTGRVKGTSGCNSFHTPAERCRRQRNR